MHTAGNPLIGSSFLLNALGFIGLIGGTEVISVMTMIPLYQARRWLGWYNTPGSLDIARHLICFANSLRTRRYGNQSPTALLGLDSSASPSFIAAFSEGEIQTGHLGYLVAERSKEVVDGMDATTIPGREASPMTITLLDLGRVNLDEPFPSLHVIHTLLALIPMAISNIACLLCALVGDWYMFFAILVGIFTSGFTTMAIGSANLTLESPRSSAPESPGRGILESMDTVMIIRGEEVGVSAITKGKFKLEGGSNWQNLLRTCGLLHLAQCLTQLIIIPQGTLFGQVMFVMSLAISWVYSYFLASFQKEKLQAELLFAALGEPLARKFHAGTTTSMAVFVCLVLFQDMHHLATHKEYDRILSAFLPDTTPVWRAWKDKVIRQLSNVNDRWLSQLEAGGEDRLLSEQDKALLQDLLGDAAAAFQAYFNLDLIL